jgi:hypothetical protein
MGYYAIGKQTSGSDDVGIGYFALYSNTTGANNVAIGTQALVLNTTASNNTAVGYQAGYTNTTGTANIAVGYQSLYANTTGNYNTAVGLQALLNNTTGVDNVAIGPDCLRSNTTGGGNISIGRFAMYFGTTASSCVAVGYDALLRTNANNNTAVGYESFQENTSGTGNTGLGWNAGSSNSTGNNNTYVGAASGNVATGGNNTFVGTSSGETITTGTKNTIIGRYNGNQGGLDIRTNSNFIVLSDGDGNPRIGTNSNGTFFVNAAILQANLTSLGWALQANGAGSTRFTVSNNEFFTWDNYNGSGFAQMDFRWNNTEVGGISFTSSATTYGTSSDYRLKDNQQPLTGSGPFIDALKPKSWSWKIDGSRGVGFIAHEVQDISPSSVVGEKDAMREDGVTPKYQSMEYGSAEFVANIVAELQDLRKRVALLESK